MLNHSVVHLKLIQYCKSTVFQIKKKKEQKKPTHTEKHFKCSNPPAPQNS